MSFFKSIMLTKTIQDLKPQDVLSTRQWHFRGTSHQEETCQRASSCESRCSSSTDQEIFNNELLQTSSAIVNPKLSQASPAVLESSTWVATPLLRRCGTCLYTTIITSSLRATLPCSIETSEETTTYDATSLAIDRSEYFGSRREDQGSQQQTFADASRPRPAGIRRMFCLPLLLRPQRPHRPESARQIPRFSHQ